LQITAETISTFILVFVTCGSSILDHGSRPLVSELGGSMASGLIVTVMIYSVGHISGAHESCSYHCIINRKAFSMEAGNYFLSISVN